jgi:hypothetical protein
MATQTKDPKTDPITCFQMHIRPSGFKVGELEGIKAAQTLYGNAVTCGAIIKTALKGGRTWSYVLEIINDHVQAGTLNELKAYTRGGANARRNNQNRRYGA